jgi:signal peptidase I
MAHPRKKSAKRPSQKSPSLKARAIAHGRAAITGLLPLVAIVLGARVLLAEPFRIPSGSMEPTLLVGDWLFVNKLRFGPHIPLTRLSLPGYATPRRNDVVVFVSPPQDPAIRITPDDITPVLVKRLVGMPGDTLVMRHGVLMVNGERVDTRNHDFVLADSVADQPQTLFDWQHRIEVTGSRFGPPPSQPSVHEWGPLVVPAGTFFMMGDNRDDSVDSRYYGVVPRENLRGTPMFVYYSYDTERGLDYFRAVTEIRWRRLGTWIH